jgi:holin-like protein
VGVIAYLDVMKTEALPILAAVIGGTAITIFVTASVTNRFGQAFRREHEAEQIGEAARDVSP